MSSQQLNNDNFIHMPNHHQHHVITDFVHTFENETGLTMLSCTDIIEDSHSIFHSFSYLIKHLFSLIDSAIPCQTFTIKGLTILQRRYFYLELSQIGIYFTKNRYIDDNHNFCTDICILTTDFWSIPDFRTSPQLAIYQHCINVFDAFYSCVDNSLITRAANGNIIVSLEYYLKFKRILINSVSSYNYNCYINNINYMNNIIYLPNQPTIYTTGPQRPQRSNCQSSISSNIQIKYQLADLIFDIKDVLSDSIYKKIMDKISLITP